MLLQWWTLSPSELYLITWACFSSLFWFPMFFSDTNLSLSRCMWVRVSFFSFFFSPFLSKVSEDHNRCLDTKVLMSTTVALHLNKQVLPNLDMRFGQQFHAILTISVQQTFMEKRLSTYFGGQKNKNNTPVSSYRVESSSSYIIHITV